MYRAKQSGATLSSSSPPRSTSARAPTRAWAPSAARSARGVRPRLPAESRPQPRGVTGAEALLRWNHPGRGVVSPVEFIPVLEETGLIVAVGDWVLRRACEGLKAWQAAGLAVAPVAVNLSAPVPAHRPRLALQGAGRPRRRRSWPDRARDHREPADAGSAARHPHDARVARRRHAHRHRRLRHRLLQPRLPPASR